MNKWTKMKDYGGGSHYDQGVTYKYACETWLTDRQGERVAFIERYRTQGGRMIEAHSKYRAWLLDSNGVPTQLGEYDEINLTECKSLVEYALSKDDLIRYSFARLGFSPHSLVYTVDMAKYPQITLTDVGKWVRDKEKGLRGYEGQYMVFNGFSLEFYHHVLKRAGVDHKELVYELNQWANKSAESHQEVCKEMFSNEL
jgi:hypothetical protein